MALVTDGILTQKLPWSLIFIGVFITVAIELAGLPSLPVAVGVYLPISTSAAMFATSPSLTREPLLVSSCKSAKA